jgi:hypothetical protein
MLLPFEAILGFWAIPGCRFAYDEMHGCMPGHLSALASEAHLEESARQQPDS